ncbi:MAG TPA: ABC-2 family transporter protein, partial [Bacillota bacterium]|nr:ABC-2 family transporter protein [Bacillota bacterium]
KQVFKIALQYKGGFMITVIIQPIAMLANIVLFKSIYAYNQTATIKGYSLEQMIWYFTAGTFVFALTWNFADSNLSRKILSGELAIDLLRPISIFKLEFGQAVALRLAAFFVEFLLGFVVFILIIFPNFMSVASVLKFLAVVFFSFLLFFLVNFLIGLASFYIKSISSLGGLKMFLLLLTGGAFIPLEFFPAWAMRIINLLPFKYIYYWPVQFFLNREFTQGIRLFLEVLGAQALWTIGLFALCKLIWRFAVKKFCAAGG